MQRLIARLLHIFCVAVILTASTLSAKNAEAGLMETFICWLKFQPVTIENRLSGQSYESVYQLLTVMEMSPLFQDASKAEVYIIAKTVSNFRFVIELEGRILDPSHTSSYDPNRIKWQTTQDFFKGLSVSNESEIRTIGAFQYKIGYRAFGFGYFLAGMNAGIKNRFDEDKNITVSKSYPVQNLVTWLEERNLAYRSE